MPFVQVVELPGEQVAPLYNNLAASRGGKVPNLFKVLGHSADMLSPAIGTADFVNVNSSVSPKDKQLAYIVTSRFNKCEYCMERHLTAALKVGLRVDQATALRSQEDLIDRTEFEIAEKAIIVLAEELAASGSLSLITLERTKEFFNEEQIVELVFVAASANMFNRIANGLHVELEPEFKQNNQ